MEAQIITLLCCYFLNRRWGGMATTLKYGEMSNQINNDAIINFGQTQTAFTETIMFILLVEHIFSYISGIFKAYELKTRGVPDKKGIDHAKYESILYWVEICIDVIIIIFIIIHFAQLSSMDMLHDLPLLNYWILFDTIIMFLTLPYMALAKILMLHGEITKNIFTLYQVQRKKLKTRRQQLADEKPKDQQNKFK